MKPLLSLVLLCIACHSTFGYLNFVDVYIEKGVGHYENFIRIDDHLGYGSDADWTKITGRNSQNGAVSYFQALRSAHEGNLYGQRGEEMKDYSFEKQIYVCSNVRIGDERPGSVLSTSQCPSGQREEMNFYVAEENNPHVEPLYFVTCEFTEDLNSDSDETGELLYSRISRQQINCFSNNHRVVETATMFVSKPLTQCPPTDNPRNGYASSVATTRGIQKAATFSCHLGYEIQGSETRQCDTSTGAWRGRVPTCSKIVCPRPYTIEHASVDRDRQYKYTDVAAYTCDEGYDFRSVSTMRCNEQGTWSDAGVECERVSCNYPGIIRNGDVKGSSYQYGDSVEFECHPGYFLEGAHEADCLATGRWSTSVPNCRSRHTPSQALFISIHPFTFFIEILCPTVSYPANGMRTQTDRGVGSEIIYSCNQGYLLEGSDTITCEQQEAGTGAWSETPPTCTVITCLALAAPFNGGIRGDDFTYGQQVGFYCDTGYTLRGSHVSTCGPDGWDAEVPTCEIVQCRPPTFGEHIQLQSENTNVYVYNNVLSFSCDGGFQLEGSSSIRCQENGRWSERVPTCEAVRCPALPAPENGARDVDDFSYGNTATFSCFPGYALEGEAESTCMENGIWDHTVPRCTPCPRGSYKDTSDNEECVACPPNSFTSSVGSTSIAHCQCDSGSAAAGGEGLCEVIECQQLTAPENGVISECGTEAGAECLISCNPACPMGTYKEGVSTTSSCIPCPRHTNSDPDSPAASVEECFCKPGYHNPSGNGCEDIDECATNNGGCNQQCTNLDGDRICTCTIPGYRLGADGATCTPAQSCPKLEASFSEGHLSCSQVIEYNAATCHIRCNPGFYFVSGVNNYVTCGPDTSYEWSHRLVNKTARIPTCTEEFFVDVTLTMSYKYRSGVHCNTLPILQSQVEEQIENAILEMNMCRKQCVITDMNITCSELSGQAQHQSELTLTFDALVKNPEENAVSPDCDPLCRRLNMREMLREAFNVKSQLMKLVNVEDNRFGLANLLPDTEIDRDSFEFGRPTMLCEDGRVFTKNRMCVPCDAGYHLPSRDLKACLPCPQGTYQDLKGQTACLPCLAGATTLGEAADHPTMCNVRVVKVGDDKSDGVQHQGKAIDVAVSEEEVDEILSVI
ncbi:hypothetical protein CAPTEDRAFT_223058 [Capitella teleta]|uniref:Sushi domain-containing protein n=1 Tax=Capitella teleta TaxID=283909 RepID=R7TM49_CAPTE|nr:hypothetical protein CAPTEDRAFT_223058 [Capitella teleta]|eukprot:ELT94724.1 hypothetical protein CAPTEDRAFT_223058 [Capitella teleta]